MVAAHPRVKALLARGARHLPLYAPGPMPSFLRRQVLRLQKKMGARDTVVEALDSFRPDLVVFSCGGTYELAFTTTWMEWISATRRRFRFIANLQIEQPYLPEAAYETAQNVCAAADAVFFLSDRNLAATRRHLLSALPNASVVQTPLRWQPADVAPWPQNQPWRFATVGRLEHVKGLGPLLHALAESLGHEPDWELHLYGSGADEKLLRDTARHLGLASRVHFHGFVDSLREVWAQNHCLLSPALEEGVPMTIPEAMLCERPVLATLVGGAGEWIEHGDNGWLCPAPSVPLLADSLRSAWDCRSAWQAMGQRAARAASARHLPQDYLRVVTA
ncbi:MAG: glycosyltransferase [Limisphaerales bacterium]